MDVLIAAIAIHDDNFLLSLFPSEGRRVAASATLGRDGDVMIGADVTIGGEQGEGAPPSAEKR